MQRAKLFIILGHFLYFDPPNNPKNQNFEKIKKGPGDITILLKCTINDNHLIYCSWNFNCNRQIFLVIFCYFLPFYPSNSPKNENIKKMKITPGYAPKLMIIYYTVFEIWQVTDVIVVFHFGQFFSFYPLTAQKINISKKWKKHLEVHHFTHAYQKLWLYDVGFLRYGVRQTDRGMKKVTYRGGCPT